MCILTYANTDSNYLSTYVSIYHLLTYHLSSVIIFLSPKVTTRLNTKTKDTTRPEQGDSEELLFNRYRVSHWDHDKVVKVDRGDGYPTM